MLKSGLDRMVGEKLFVAEAKARGITVDQLVQTEIKAKVKAPTDEEISQVYEASKEELGEATLEQVKPQIVQYLNQRQEAMATRELVDSLRAKYKPEIKLEAPRIEVAAGDIEGSGPADAPVTIVAFSDYECPYCKRAEVTVAEVLAAYPNKIRYYHRDFPLEFHADARPAAEAARCANAQGKFWPYHKALFASAELSSDRLKAIADETGVDRTAFDECVASKKFSAAIDRDIADGSSAGVNGTPAFFVNGRMLSVKPISRNLLGRIEAINRATARIRGGEVRHRMPVGGSGDEFDRLAANLNSMLDEIERLMGGIRAVTDNIAHDLRSPLTRLKNELEQALATDAPDRRGAIEREVRKPDFAEKAEAAGHLGDDVALDA